MEFNKKLNQLRKQKGITQEELANALYVSRTAVSKWESGRGYPNIESLRALADFFSITVDELLSGNELLAAVEQDVKDKESHYKDLVFGLLDCGIIVFLFIPFFAQRHNGIIEEVVLLNMSHIPLYLHISYYLIILATFIWGILTLALQNLHLSFWLNCKNKISFVISVIGIALFVVSQQPYPAILILIFLLIKTMMLIKKWQ